MNLLLPLRQPGEFKKVAIGLLYTFAIELIFFGLAVIGISILWYGAFHSVGIADHQNTYIYDPHEIKYLFITVGGYRKRIAVKRYLHRRKIIICQ